MCVRDYSRVYLVSSMSMRVKTGTCVDGGATFQFDDIIFSVTSGGRLQAQFVNGSTRLTSYIGVDCIGYNPGTSDDDERNSLVLVNVPSYAARHNIGTSAQPLGNTSQDIKDQVGESLSGQFFNFFNRRWYFVSAVITVVSPRTLEVCVFSPAI